MKGFFGNLAFFVVFCFVFMSFTACTGMQSNVTNNKAGKAPVSVNSQPAGGNAAFPMLPSGLAEAEFELLDGAKMKISERKGKVLLLNIWGIWCGPCRAEMPHLVEMHNKYHEKGFEIIGLNIGDQNLGAESIDAIKKFGEAMKLNYTLARSAQASTEEFYKLTRQRVVPQTVLVDREGRLRGVFVGGGLNVINSMKASIEKTLGE